MAASGRVEAEPAPLNSKGAAPGRRRGLLANEESARLPKAVGAGAEEIEEAEVAKDLELLADFWLDVLVAGVEFLEIVFEGVDFR